MKILNVGYIEQNPVNKLFYVGYQVELSNGDKDTRNFASLDRKEVEKWRKQNKSK